MELPYGAAGPAPSPSEAVPHDELEGKMWTWMSNNMPAPPPQALKGKGKGKDKGRGSFMVDSGSPAMNTWVPSLPKSLPKPSTATSAWQSAPAAGSSSSSTWNQTEEPWNAESNRGWRGQRWSGRHWQDDADRPPAAKRGSAPYQHKGKKGRKGHDQGS